MDALRFLVRHALATSSTNFRADAAMLWILCLWIRGHARTRSFTDERAGTGKAFGGTANAQAECGAALALAGGRPVVAAALLRLQCLERGQAGRKVALPAPKSGEARSGSESGGVGVE